MSFLIAILHVGIIIIIKKGVIVHTKNEESIDILKNTQNEPFIISRTRYLLRI